MKLNRLRHLCACEKKRGKEHPHGPSGRARATWKVVACKECYSVTALTYISREGAMREACLDSTNELITLYLYK